MLVGVDDNGCGHRHARGRAPAPFLLEGGSILATVISVVLVALIALSLPRGRRSKEHYAGWDRFVL